MTQLKKIVSALDSEFRFYKGRDISKNGLQVRGNPDVRKIAVACDAALETIEKAIRARADLLIAHHGLLWRPQDPRSLKHACQRLAVAKRAGLSVYAMHLPLDAHPVLGNNAVLARLIRLKKIKPFGKYEGAFVALKGETKIFRKALARKIDAKVGAARIFPFGPAHVKRVAICSGSGGFLALEAARQGIDTLVIGEMKHSDYHPAKEAGCNVIEAGHYHTEILGVQAVGSWLKHRFGIPFALIDAPTGL